MLPHLWGLPGQSIAFAGKSDPRTALPPWQNLYLQGLLQQQLITCCAWQMLQHACCMDTCLSCHKSRLRPPSCSEHSQTIPQELSHQHAGNMQAIHTP